MSDRYLWIAVTADEYELPLAVTETAKELGQIFGIKTNSIIDAVKKNRSGKLSGRKFMKVRTDNE